MDLAKISPDRLYLKCVKCGEQIPILRRLVKAKTDTDETVSTSADAKASKEVSSAPAEFLHDDLGGGDAEEEDAEAGSWLATYADMISILLIFFVLMFAISSVDKKKFAVVMGSINAALGGKIDFKAGIVVSPDQPVESKNPLPAMIDKSILENLRQSVKKEKSDMSDLRKQLETMLEQQQLQGNFSLSDEAMGLVVIAQDMTMFDSGSADIRTDAREAMKRIAALLRQIPNDIIVEGHTDDTPIRSGRFPSNWELSVMRATNVIHFFQEECGLPANRLSAAGYSYYRPRYDLASQDRGKNRRIEVVIKKKYGGKVMDELLKSE